MRKSQEVIAQNDEFTQAFDTIEKLEAEVTRIVVISPELTKATLGGLAVGHIISEGGVGLGKTLLARTLAIGTGGVPGRVQCTPEVEEKDIVGSYIYNQRTGELEFFKGPIFSNVLHVDEINRMRTKTQSALLEPMEERQVTTIRNETFALPDPFTVIANHNPNAITQGVNPLIEAQLDRFAVSINMPPHDAKARKAVYARSKLNLEPRQVVDTADIINLRKVVGQVMIHDAYEDALNDMIDEGQKHPYIDSDNTLLSSGRPLKQGLALAAFSALSEKRRNVKPDDLLFAVRYAFPHRMVLNYEGREARRTGYDIANEIAERAIIKEVNIS